MKYVHHISFTNGYTTSYGVQSVYHLQIESSDKILKHEDVVEACNKHLERKTSYKMSAVLSCTTFIKC